MDRAKPFCIAKLDVWKAYKQVKANRGAAGVDGQSIEDFDEDLSKNLYRIWNRMSSGSYFPPPVRRVDIPKGDSGGTRPLGIPTVSDRIAQMVVKRHLEPILEPVFHRDSYGYRPGKSAHAVINPLVDMSDSHGHIRRIIKIPDKEPAGISCEIECWAAPGIEVSSQDVDWLPGLWVYFACCPAWPNPGTLLLNRCLRTFLGGFSLISDRVVYPHHLVDLPQNSSEGRRDEDDSEFFPNRFAAIFALLFLSAGVSLISYGVDKSRDIAGWPIWIILAESALVVVSSFLSIDLLAAFGS